MRRLLLGAGIAVCLVAGPVRADCTITVNGDGIGGDVADGEMTLTEAEGIAFGDPPALSCLTQAELDQIGGETSIPVIPGTCGTLEARFAIVGGCGASDRDLIHFADGVGTIEYGALTLNDGDSIDGRKSSGGRVTLAGPGPAGSVGAIIAGRTGLGPTPGAVSITNLILRNHPGAGIWVDDLRGTAVISGVDIFANGGDGITLGTPPGAQFPDCAGVVTIGQPGAQGENYIHGNGGWGVAIYEACNQVDAVGVRIQNSFIGIDEPLGLADRGNALGGINVFFARNVVIGGDEPTERNYIGWNDGPGIRVRGPSLTPLGTEPRIEGNWIGLARDITTSARPNTTGILLSAGERITIGGTTPAQGNVVSGNAAHGIVNISSAGIALGGLLVQNNIIGLNPARTFVLPNGSDGIALLADGNAAIRDNVISGNAVQGIYLQGSSAVVVENNVLGLRGSANTANDNTAAGNGQSGIWIDGSPGCTVAGNRIAANGGFGVRVSGDAADGAVVKGNLIGLSNGNALQPNGVGVFVEGGADGTMVGGAGAGEGNTISGNTFEGVRITGAGTDGGVVRNNRIGTAPAGSGDLGNGSRGVRVDSGAGTTEILDNLISGNGSDGVSFEASTGSPKVQGNTIGLDAAGNPLPNAQSGLAIAAGSTGVLVGGGSVPNTIAGNANYGVYIADAGTSANTVQGNLIGGSGGRGNVLAGVTLRNGAQDNLVDANTIVGQAAAPGVEIAGASTRLNSVRGNRIGIDATEAVVANQVGVRLGEGAHDNAIGSGGRNTISGNTGAGVLLSGAGSFNTVEGNYIGLTGGGSGDRGNGGDGVRIEAGSSNTAIRDNTIAGNVGAGIQVRDAATVETTIVRNRIGINAAASFVVPNDGDGILVGADAQRSNIGLADSPANANLIRGNGGAGIRVVSGQDHRIRVNSIGSNSGLGVDLGATGVTANDAVDADTGANALQNFPLLSNVLRNAGMVSMTVAMDSTPNTDFTANVYRNADCDASGHGEAEAYLGEVALATNATGAASVSAMFPLADPIPVLAWTATATPTIAAIQRGTSELSPCAVTTVVGDALFANSFESGAVVPTTPAGDASPSMQALQRTGEGGATLVLRWRNDGPNIEPAAALEIRTDRAVVVGSITTAGAACELIGAIVCELAERAPGVGAEILVPLRFGAGPLAVEVDLRDTSGRLERRSYFLD